MESDVPFKNLVTPFVTGLLWHKLTYHCLDTIVQRYDYHGFPVVNGEDLLGFVAREKLAIMIGEVFVDSRNYKLTLGTTASRRTTINVGNYRMYILSKLCRRHGHD